MLEAALKQKLMQTLTHGHDKGCVWVGWAGSTHTKTFSPVRANFGAASFPDPSVLALDPAVLVFGSSYEKVENIRNSKAPQH